MKKLLLIALTIGAIAIALAQPGGSNAVILLLLAGVIPGTSQVISPTMTLAIITACSGLLVTLLIVSVRQKLLRHFRLNEMRTRSDKDVLPRRHFSQI